MFGMNSALKEIVMVSSIFSDTQYQALKTSLDAADLRQRALAANVANVNTPGYRRQDLSEGFETEFRKALQSGDQDKIQQIKVQIVDDPKATANRFDGNNVNLEREMVELTKNSAQFDVSSTLISRKLQAIRMAITGKG